VILLGVVPIVIVLWLISKYCSGRPKPTKYARSQPRPVDGSDGTSAAQGAEASYFPGDWFSDKGGLPVSGMGPSGKGGYGSRPRNKDE
jgi:hypothetical protein